LVGKNVKTFVIPEKSLFPAFGRGNAILSGLLQGSKRVEVNTMHASCPFGFLSAKDQMGFRINFLSSCFAGLRENFAE
jgi:hypothetical protein